MKITTKEHFISSKQDSSCQRITKVQSSASLLVIFFGNEEIVIYSQIPESGILMTYISDPKNHVHCPVLVNIKMHSFWTKM